MKLVTYEAGGAQKLGAVVDDRVVDLQQASNGELPGTMLELIAGGKAMLERARQVTENAPEGTPLAQVRLLAPIPTPPRNVWCVGLNYKAHYEEGLAEGSLLNQELPEYPTFFTKLPTSVVGPEEGVRFDARISTKLDWEAELAVIIGRQGRDISEDEAMDYIFGYTVANDVSVRDIQRIHGNQWFRGKSMDTHCPMGPWIVTADEIPDPHSLDISLKVNGVTKQDLNTSYLIFPIQRLIAEMARGTTIIPGDILLTGTPAGVGFARTPPEYLAPGDVMEVEVERVGRLVNPVVDAEAAGA